MAVPGASREYIAMILSANFRIFAESPKAPGEHHFKVIELTPAIYHLPGMVVSEMDYGDPFRSKVRRSSEYL